MSVWVNDKKKLCTWRKKEIKRGSVLQTVWKKEIRKINHPNYTINNNNSKHFDIGRL